MKYHTVSFKIPIYTSEEGLKLEWEKDFLIKISKDDETILLQANEAGFASLARLFLTLADREVPEHTHIHLDDLNSLADGSIDIVIEKVK